jgi:cell division protein DivIC
MKLLNSLKNKYLLASVLFLAFIMFFDDRDLITNYHYRRQLGELQQSKKFYEDEINKTRAELEQLKADATTIEKYAREKYLMKRDNEDIFLVPGE